jgi:hypothetical protein
MPADRIADGLRYLTAELSATPEEFWRDNRPQGAMLLEGLRSQGFVIARQGRVAVSDAGRRRLADSALALRDES